MWFNLLLPIAVAISFVGTAFAVPTQNAALYETTPQPLSLEQCGQCHPQHFQDIKQTGGRHQFDCRECHTTFHAYNPRKNNYTDIMPNCSSCHDLVHGEKHNQCLLCHENPHAIKLAPTISQVENLCADCHTKQVEQLATQPSLHSELSCGECHHSDHGLIPSCAECHQPHFDKQLFTNCTTCHPVHQPLQIALTGRTDLNNCAACHATTFTKWDNSTSKHGEVGCTLCHTAHKAIPTCQSCHETPPAHSKTMLEKFPRCLDCHLDVHDLPTKE